MALYRKWRPQIFEDVVGQTHITHTLKNQIQNNSIAHAYLFCGTRGTGKTSTAKIFARAVNCLNPVNNNPCNACEICTGIQHESVMDVIEIDAASNNGVDDIRELRENIKYPPTKGKYKVYIVDEVHMLSTGAFNALLKTLEEPPSYVLFILATTEPQKIPATILSRCQRFDFRRVTEQDLIKRMTYICEKMNVKIDEPALTLIARNSDGAMRDALSILDQCVSFGTDTIRYEDVINILGTVSDDFLFQLVDSISQRDGKKSIEWIERLVVLGKDIHQFIKDLIVHYRNLMMTRITDDLEGIIHLSKENIQRLKEQGKNLTTESITRCIQDLSQLSVDAKWSSNPRILLEVCVIKLSNPSMDTSYEALIERIERLEQMVQNGEIQNEPKNNLVNKSTQTVASKEPKEEPMVDEIQRMDLKPIDLEGFKKGWKEILKVIKKKRISLYAFLVEGQLIKVDGKVLIISFKEGFGFHKEAAQKEPNKGFIEAVISKMVGQKVSIKCIMENEAKHLKSTPTHENEEEKEVQKIIEMFGTDNVEIIDG